MIYCDFEFFDTTSEFVRIVCATFYKSGEKPEEFWLLGNPDEKLRLVQYLTQNKNEVFVGFAATAEARCFYALGFNPLDFKWIDQQTEWKCLTNHNDRLNWGDQLVDGKVKKTRRPPPKWERTEEDSKTSFKHTHSLAEATFKLTGVIRDTEHKDKMRDILISCDVALIQANKEAIQKYCTEDVIYMPDMQKRIVEEYKKVGVPFNTTLKNEMLLRGEYSAANALMESWGYPIDYEATKNFAESVASIFDECQREINALFPDVKPFKFDRKTSRFTWNQTATREWLTKNVDVKRWMKTDTNQLSLSLEAWEKFFPFRHEYPKDNFGAQMVRFLKLRQHLNGFSPNKTKKRTFWDYVGPDKRVRPYANIYGSQSSRTQQSSTGFLMLKPAWMRSLCVPKKGKAIGAYDYSSEEFLISALWAGDKNMIEAYKSGDVYLAYGKLVGAIPKDGTKAEFKKERDLQKPIVLGMSYLMSKYGLSDSLTSATGRVWTEDEAQTKIDEFKEAFPNLAEAQEEVMKQYEEDGYLKLPCGWYNFGDNDNFRSVCNVPIQGLGASILRRAATSAIRQGLKVIMTLHDAIYIEYDSGDYAAMDILHECMREAFIHYFTDKKSASLIRLDGFSWSPDYQKDSQAVTPGGIKIDISDLYVDERGVQEYKQFSKYFEKMEDIL